MRQEEIDSIKGYRPVQGDERAAGSSAPACSPSDIEVAQRREKMWRDECVRIVNALADLARLPRDPCPGWQPCIEKIKAMMANVGNEGSKPPKT